MSFQPAPVAFFAFNRPTHTARTLDALAANVLAERTDVHVFVDGPRNAAETSKIEEVKAIAGSARAFANVYVWPSASNRGLYASITSGITRILLDHQHVIVVEDDILTSPYFLQYMNDGLGRYEHDSRVGSIHGYSPPIEGLPEFFFLRGGDCWGWATWRDRWALFDSDPTRMIRELVRRDALEDFMETHGASSLRLLCKRAHGHNESWAILWHVSLWLSDLLTLHPGRSFVDNIGHDNSGTHSQVTDRYAADIRLQYHGLPAQIAVHDAAAARAINTFLDHVGGLIGRPVAWVRRYLAQRAARAIASKLQ